MDSKRRARLRKQAQSLTATVQVGKDGATPGIAAEIARQLDTVHLVKVRMLRSAGAEGLGATDIAEKLAEAAFAELVEVRGHTAVFTRRAGRRPQTYGA